MPPDTGRESLPINPTRITFAASIILSVYRGLEKLSYLKSGVPESAPSSWLLLNKNTAPQNESEIIWVFVSTIGELNLSSDFLKKLLTIRPKSQLVLISDHPHYRDAYLTQFPRAHFANINGRSTHFAELANRLPPTLFLIIEIPCRLSDAPCRLPFSALYFAKQKGAKIAVVNGWIYGQQPRCTIDNIEKKLLDQHYLKLIDLYLVQTSEIQNELINAGVAPKRISVSGNLKFDAMDTSEFDINHEKSPPWLKAIRDDERPCIVAGCLSDIREQQTVLDAFCELLKNIPNALLIIVPRHPEFNDRMALLENFIQERNLSYNFKTRMDAPDISSLQVLVVDTIGELRGFYSISDITFVGVDHNILEPLSFRKPTTVVEGWHEGYPSFPVFSIFKEKNLLHIAQTHMELCNYWQSLFTNKDYYTDDQSKMANVLVSETGAVDRTLHLINNLLQTSTNRKNITYK